MRIVKMFVGMAVALFVLALGVAPAQADSGWIYVTGGKAMSNSDDVVTVCDTSLDGNRVRANFWEPLSGDVYASGWAPSGGCWSEWASDAYDLRVCVEGSGGCSAWHDR
jgi:hypothetical protein